MNITTNYSTGNIQFNGGMNMLATVKYRQQQSSRIANILGQKYSDIVKLTRYTSDKRFGFLNLLTDKFNSYNFYRPTETQDDPNVVKKIYSQIKRPHREHFSLVTNFHGSMETLSRVFNATHNDAKRTKFAYRVNKEILNKSGETYKFMLPELLESHNSKKYVCNYEKYKSYLILNRENSDVISNLDTMIENKTYNQEVYDHIIRQKELMDKFPYEDSDDFNAQIFADNYTKERGFLFDTIHQYLYEPIKMDENNNAQLLRAIFNTTNAKNYEIRSAFINQYYQNIYVNRFVGYQLDELNKLFNKIDQDKNVKNFIQKINTKKLRIRNISEINNVLDNIPTLKLNVLSDNAIKIINTTAKEQRISVLQQELENPFFKEAFYGEKYRRYKKHTLRMIKNEIADLPTYLTNGLRLLEYKILTLGKDAATNKNIAQVQPSVAPIIQDVHIAESLDKELILESPQIEKKVQTTKTKKEEIKNEVFNILNIKLGRSTFAKQKEAYGKNATKIKLSMLPEIFSSVADTRKADRAVGKYRINSSNKDVLDLYLLITGSNKKYINYLLKKRNVDGTRMFEVKEIISMIKKAETKIAKNKKSNPNYRARDARQYYNHLYESKIQQYGKVTRACKNKINTYA